MGQNRYKLPFKSAIDYQLTSLEMITLKNGKKKHKIVRTDPEFSKILQNIYNLGTWGFTVDISQDLIINDYGALMMLVAKGTNLNDFLQKNLWLKQLISINGYKLEIKPAYFEEKPKCSFSLQTNIICENEGQDANYDGLYCVNYEDYLIPPEKIKLTANSKKIISFLKKYEKEHSKRVLTKKS